MLGNSNIEHRPEGRSVLTRIKIVGCEMRETIIDKDAIIFCYKDYKIVKGVYEKLEEQRLKQEDMHWKCSLKLILSPEEEYPYKLVAEFFNRDKYIHANPPKFPFEGVDTDELRERTFLTSIDTKEDKIIYVNDVPIIK